ncbi:hypothetical protein B0H14DRAFT_31642 [Mycena olivaceomarginata]|nr:hypothetical protein B0H14DRAFT_31642 [Mycena olivaceomarginata]
MIIPRYDPPTPASSQGSSTTILPSHNVISSKQYYYEEIEPERGRSLSRASSGSSRSSGVLVLPSPSSIDSGSQNLRYAPSGFQIQSYPPAPSIITAKLNEMRQTADSALKSSNPELRHSIPPASMSFGSQPPMPYSDSWAQWWAQAAPLVPDMGSPGLFGPRSPVGDYTSIAPTPRPLSTVTERTEPPSAAVAPGRPSQILPSVPILAPSDGGRSGSSRSSRSSRSSSAGRSQSTRSIISVENLPLPDSSRTAPQPPPVIVVPGPRSQHPRIIPQTPTQAPIVINPPSVPVSLLSQPIQCSIPSVMTPERRGSRSRSRSPIHLSPPIVRYPTQPIIISARRTPPPAVIIPQRSRSRSRSPRSYYERYPSYRRHSPDVVRQPPQVPIIDLGWGAPSSPVIIRRSRSRSRSPRRYERHPSHRGHSPHLARPTQVPVVEWSAPPVIIDRPSRSRSPSIYGRPYRRHSPSPRRHTVIIQPETWAAYPPKIPFAFSCQVQQIQIALSGSGHHS